MAELRGTLRDPNLAQGTRTGPQKAAGGTPTGACAVGGNRHIRLEHLVYSAVSILGKGAERQRQPRDFENEADLLRSMVSTRSLDTSN